MEDILLKINKAYEKGINNPRFQEALDEVIRNSEKQGREEKKEKIFKKKEAREER